MRIITKESLNERGTARDSIYLKCDIPIWEEFTVGLEECGHLSVNNNFRGVRGIKCKVPNSNIHKDVYIVTHNPKAQKLFGFIKDWFLNINKESYKNVNIMEYERRDKFVYVIEFEYT